MVESGKMDLECMCSFVEPLRVLVDGPRTVISLDITGIRVTADSSNGMDIELEMSREQWQRTSVDDRVHWLYRALRSVADTYDSHNALEK